MKLNRILAMLMALLLLVGGAALAEPVVTEPTTLTIMAQVPSYYPEQDLGNVSGLAAYEKISGVTIEWDNVNSEVFKETLTGIIEAGADAIIVQDVGMAHLAHQIAPALEIHGSTQMSLTSAEGIRLAQQFGVSRVVMVTSPEPNLSAASATVRCS